MKMIQSGLYLVLLTLASSSRAYLVVEPHNIDEYLKLGKTILIVECLPSDDETLYGRFYSRKARVLDVLQGELKKEQIIHVLVGRPLTPSRIYLIFSGQTLNEKGELDALSYSPGTVEIALWGEISKAEKEQRLAKFLKELAPLPLREKLLRILEQRRSDMKWEQQQLDMEKKRLDALLLK